MSESTAGITIPEARFAAVMGRLQEALGLPNQNQLAKAMGMASNTYAQRKKNSSIPWDDVVRLVEAHGLDADWIISGTESRPVSPPAQADGAGLDVALLTAVISGVEEGLADRKLRLPAERRARIVALVYDYALARGTASREAFARFLDALTPE